MAKVIINDREETYEDGIRLVDIAAIHQDEYKDDIVLAKYKGSLTELHKVINGVGTLEFLTTADKDGRLQAKCGFLASACSYGCLPIARQSIP